MQLLAELLEAVLAMINMKTSNFLKILLLFICINIYGQEKNENKSEPKIFTKAFFGIGEIELENNYKLNANFSGGSIGLEFTATEFFLISLELEYLRAKADYFDLDGKFIHLSNNYIQLPVSVGVNQNVSENTAIYGKIGFVFSYLYKSKSENLKIDLDNSIDNLGINFAVAAAAGIRQKINDDFNLSLGLRTQADTFSISNGNSSNIWSINELYAFELGIDYKF